MYNLMKSLLTIPILVLAALCHPINSLGSDSAVSRYLTRSGKSLLIEEIRQKDERFTGYMGHDTFSIKENKLIRSFPVYLPTDTHNNPTGGTRQLAYGLIPGEAIWQLKLVN